MKKVILAFSLFMFVGSFGATAFAASTDTQIEFRNNDDKKKKKKKKKSSKKILLQQSVLLKNQRQRQVLVVKRNNILLIIKNVHFDSQIGRFLIIH